LYLPALQDVKEFESALKAARKGGAAGISLFDYNALSNEMIELMEGII